MASRDGNAAPKPKRPEYPDTIRWRGKVRVDQLTGVQLRARLSYLRRRLAACLRWTPGAAAEQARWLKWIHRYEILVDKAPR